MLLFIAVFYEVWTRNSVHYMTCFPFCPFVLSAFWVAAAANNSTTNINLNYYITIKATRCRSGKAIFTDDGHSWSEAFDCFVFIAAAAAAAITRPSRPSRPQLTDAKRAWLQFPDPTRILTFLPALPFGIIQVCDLNFCCLPESHSWNVSGRFMLRVL